MWTKGGGIPDGAGAGAGGAAAVLSTFFVLICGQKIDDIDAGHSLDCTMFSLIITFLKLLYFLPK